MTQKELAARIGMSGQYITDILKGKRNPKDVTMARIAEGFGLSLDDLLLAGGGYVAPAQDGDALARIEALETAMKAKDELIATLRELIASKDETIAALKGASNQDAPMATYPARAGSARTTRTE